MKACRYHVRSTKFPVLQEDHDECCNPGTYGKSLVDYLKLALESKGYEVSSTLAEDFGRWMEIKTKLSVTTHIAIRRAHEREGLADFAISVDDTSKKWSWRRFRFIDIAEFQEQLASDLDAIIRADNEIELVAYNFDDYPDPLINPSYEREA